MNVEVDKFLEKTNKWKKEFTALRTLINSCSLEEEFKWMHPCYTHNEKNVVLFHGFKAYCALSFFKGALLKDPENILVQPTENSNEGRQIRFTSADEIIELEPIVKQYIYEAIEVEKAGLQVKKKTLADFDIPEELVAKFNEVPAFKAAFEKLTAGRRKGYLLHFSQAKQSDTRTARIEKYMERIMNGFGIRDCVCGHSKRMPNCDGSHKYL